MYQILFCLTSCDKMFLDMGANVGVNALFLYANDSYFHKSKGMRPLMNKVFGQSRDDVCYRGFEPNPLHEKRLQGFRNMYSELNMEFFPYAVGTRNKTQTFYKKHDTKSNMVGFGKTYRFDYTPYKINVIDISNYIVENVPSEATVFVKMDIEGYEYEVLFYLITKGILCKFIDYLSIEFHERYCNGPLCKLEPDLKRMLANLQYMKCNTTVKFMDDETYLHITEKDYNILK